MSGLGMGGTQGQRAFVTNEHEWADEFTRRGGRRALATNRFARIARIEQREKGSCVRVLGRRRGAVEPSPGERNSAKPSLPSPGSEKSAEPSLPSPGEEISPEPSLPSPWATSAGYRRPGRERGWATGSRRGSCG